MFSAVTWVSWIFKLGIRGTNESGRDATTGSAITGINNRDYAMVRVAVRALPREGESVVVIGSDKITKFYHKRVRAL